MRVATDRALAGVALVLAGRSRKLRYTSSSSATLPWKIISGASSRASNIQRGPGRSTGRRGAGDLSSMAAKNSVPESRTTTGVVPQGAAEATLPARPGGSAAALPGGAPATARGAAGTAAQAARSLGLALLAPRLVDGGGGDALGHARAAAAA